MQCIDARPMMAAVLDEGAEPSALAAHCAECAACAAEWEDLLAFEAWFGAQALCEPPHGFVGRTLRRIERNLGQLPAWQVNLMQIGSIVAGTLALGFAAAAVLHGFSGWTSAPLLVRWLGALGEGVRALVVAGGSAAEAGLGWPLAMLLGLVIALAWFGALVIPRAAAAPRRIRM